MSHIIISKTEQDNAVFLYFFTLYLIHTILLFQKITLIEKDKLNIEHKLLNVRYKYTYTYNTNRHTHKNMYIYKYMYMYANKLYLIYILCNFYTFLCVSQNNLYNHKN